MLVALKNVTGAKVGDIELSDAVFAAPVSVSLMHQALVRQLANARLGTHDTKERWEVSGGGRKPWRQKGTGRARQGSIRAGQWIGGGTVFGPTPRKYTQSLNKKMQRSALRSALSAKAAAGQLIVVDELAVSEAKTKQMVRLLNDLGASQNTLLVLADKNQQVWRSANNLPKVKTLISGYINVRDLLGHDTVLLARDAVEHIELWLGSDAPSTFAAEHEADDNESLSLASESMANAPVVFAEADEPVVDEAVADEAVMDDTLTEDAPAMTAAENEADDDQPPLPTSESVVGSPALADETLLEDAPADEAAADDATTDSAAEGETSKKDAAADTSTEE